MGMLGRLSQRVTCRRGAVVSLRSEVLSGCVKRVRFSITSSQDHIWQRTVEQYLDFWVGHESASRFLVRSRERCLSKERRRKYFAFFSHFLLELRVF